jgi:hypothetical protein
VQAVKFNAEVAGPDRVRTARVGHLFQCDDGVRRKVLAIDSGDPTCILFEGGTIMSVPAGSVVWVEAEASPRAARTVKLPVPAAPVMPVSVGLVRGVVYHQHHEQHTLMVGDLIEGRFRLTRIADGDPVRLVLLDAPGVTSSRDLCGGGSVARWIF